MRLYHKVNMVLSEDDTSSPKRVRFSELEQEFIDNTIQEGGGRTVKIAADTVDFEIPMGEISQGAWFYLYADHNFSLKLDNGTARAVMGNRPNFMWVTFSSIKISTGADDTRLTYAIAGQ